MGRDTSALQPHEAARDEGTDAAGHRSRLVPSTIGGIWQLPDSFLLPRVPSVSIWPDRSRTRLVLLRSQTSEMALKPGLGGVDGWGWTMSKTTCFGESPCPKPKGSFRSEIGHLAWQRMCVCALN